MPTVEAKNAAKNSESASGVTPSPPDAMVAPMDAGSELRMLVKMSSDVPLPSFSSEIFSPMYMSTIAPATNVRLEPARYVRSKSYTNGRTYSTCPTACTLANASAP